MEENNQQEGYKYPNQPDRTPDEEKPGYYSRAASPLTIGKSDRFGNPVGKSMFTDKQRKELEKKIRGQEQESKKEVEKLLNMKKTAEIEAMGFDPRDTSKDKEVVIILKRIMLGKPEFILKKTKEAVLPIADSNGGVTWVYVKSPTKKIIVNAVHQIRLTEDLVEKIVKRDDGKYEVKSKDGDRSFGVYDSEDAALKRLRQIEFFKNTKG